MPPRNIVIRGPNWVGDAVLGIPAMKAVRQRCPEARITLLVRPWVAGLFDHAPFVDSVWTRPRPGLWNWLATAREMRQRGFDLAILLPNSFESALTAFAGGIDTRAGYATDRRGWLLNRGVEVPIPYPHQSEYYLRLIDHVLGPGEHPPIDIEAAPEEWRAARALLSAQGADPARSYVVVCPGAAFGSAKQWFEERFAAAADRVAGTLDAPVVIVGSPTEVEAGERIRTMVSAPAYNLCGRTGLGALLGVLSRARVVLTNDSGPMHMAAALGVPTVAVFGSTDARVTRPVGRATRIVRHDVDCSPCMLRKCPIDHRCMEAVTVGEVVEAALDLVATGATR